MVVSGQASTAGFRTSVIERYRQVGRTCEEARGEEFKGRYNLRWRASGHFY